MTQENYGLRVTGEVFLEILGTDKHTILGPLAAEYVGISSKDTINSVMDTRRGKRSSIFASVANPTEPTGKLTLISAPKKAIAAAFLGILGNNTTQNNTGTVTNLQISHSENPYPMVLGHIGISNVVIKNVALTTTYASNTYTVDSVHGKITPVDAGALDNVGTVALSYTYTGHRETISGFNTGYGIKLLKSNISNVVVTSNLGITATLGIDYEIISAHEGIIRVLDGSPLLTNAPSIIVTYNFGTITNQTITLGSESKVSARIILTGTNDSSAGGSEYVRWECADAMLTPSTDINLIGNDHVKIEFNLAPQGVNTVLSFPRYVL
jgi:hypothetical protein